MHDIRPEQPADGASIRSVNERAFGGGTEAALVEALRRQGQPLVSLVAVIATEVVGHILFSPVTLASGPDLSLMGLAPMAVLPEHQRQGIGTSLVRAGLDECRRLKVDAVVVLGHAAYYPRFGFVPASTYGLASEYDVPDDVFLAVELEAGRLAGRSGTIRYHPAFAAV